MIKENNSAKAKNVYIEIISSPRKEQRLIFIRIYIDLIFLQLLNVFFEAYYVDRLIRQLHKYLSSLDHVAAMKGTPRAW